MSSSIKDNRLLIEAIKKIASMNDTSEVNQRNALQLSDELEAKVRYIMKEFRSIGIGYGEGMDYVISHGLNSCGLCTNFFLIWSVFMQNKICKSDEKLAFSVLNPKQTYDRDLYTDRRVSEGYVLIKKVEIGAEVESFNIMLRGDPILLIDYYAGIWQEIFNISPAFALERAIEIGIDEIESTLRDGVSIEDVFSTTHDFLANSVEGIKQKNDALDVTSKSIFNSYAKKHQAQAEA